MRGKIKRPGLIVERIENGRYPSKQELQDYLKDGDSVSRQEQLTGTLKPSVMIFGGYRL